MPVTVPETTREIVGATWSSRPAPWWVPAGLESTQGPGAKPAPYVMYNAAEDGPQGWITVRRHRRSRRGSRRPRLEDDE